MPKIKDDAYDKLQKENFKLKALNKGYQDALKNIQYKLKDEIARNINLKEAIKLYAYAHSSLINMCGEF